MKNSKIITYDLCNNSKNYNALYEYFRSYPIWAHITESTWLISTEKSCKTIALEICELLDSDDRFFITDVNFDAAWKNVICDSDYLKSKL